jgi:hypothetical protein
MSEEEDLQSAIDNIHQSLIGLTRSIVSSLAIQSDFRSDAFRWVEYANQLRRLVPDYSVPRWLSDACSEFGSHFTNNTNSASSLTNFVTRRAPQIAEPILVGDAATLNLEQLFTEQSERFHLDQVFENLVSRLSELIAADVIENRVIHESLKRLNALFIRTKKGSLSTVILTMNFGRFFLRSFGGVLKANKYAKPIIETFEEEFSEASEVVQKAEEETKKVMIQRLISSQRLELFLESNPELEDTVAGFLPAPNNNKECEQGGDGDAEEAV